MLAGCHLSKRWRNDQRLKAAATTNAAATASRKTCWSRRMLRIDVPINHWAVRAIAARPARCQIPRASHDMPLPCFMRTPLRSRESRQPSDVGLETFGRIGGLGGIQDLGPAR